MGKTLGQLTYDGKPIQPWESLTTARGKLAGAKCREASLAITKLDEAEMWFARIPLEAPRG